MELEQLLTFFVSLLQFLRFFRNNFTISGKCIYKIGRKVTQLAFFQQRRMRSWKFRLGRINGDLVQPDWSALHKNTTSSGVRSQ